MEGDHAEAKMKDLGDSLRVLLQREKNLDVKLWILRQYLSFCTTDDGDGGHCTQQTANDPPPPPFPFVHATDLQAS